MAMAWIWTGMAVVSLIFAAWNGTMDAVGAAALEGAGAAVQLCIAMAGVLCLWSGVMEIMSRCGLSEKLAALLRELCKMDFRWIRLHYLYPDEFTDELIDTIAAEDKDYASSNMLVWFVDEQVEEEESARDMITACEAVEGNKFGLYMLDKELAARTYTQASPLATANA